MQMLVAGRVHDTNSEIVEDPDNSPDLFGLTRDTEEMFTNAFLVERQEPEASSRDVLISTHPDRLGIRAGSRERSGGLAVGRT